MKLFSAPVEADDRILLLLGNSDIGAQEMWKEISKHCSAQYPFSAPTEEEKDEALALEVGAVVAIQSGGNAMTVKEMREKNCLCVWFIHNGETREGWFPYPILRVLKVTGR